ncbi:GalNAc(5)-diNAcBac-PP-undecaprenol beta-1,3-glucosyltransferase [Actinomadura rubteroloni]|uniref:GalNAc(5)-diNAcBac-PP-undecaprenol beta-1,3-glucosyltransferase n=1 Tax=Actinomadura rubteroloni TaxID=1926885 RepID=A0A2P4UQ25_9ACTN|nr:glycosyltransferase [Actinomadura rubteroloni]POM27124.1 GalNAc(5)-diNAcBac-PP-undecaprenol beta-1,3-glucosyltransferase [Actinomadura rubteroloni]
MNERPLVLVTVGTDHHRFDRLIAWVDAWAAGAGDRVRCVVQHGSSRAPEHAEARDFLDHAELLELMERAAVVVTHAGASTIGEARRLGRLPVIVPRDPTLEEIVDGHQIDFLRRIADKGLVVACASEEDLHGRLDALLDDPRRYLLAEGDSGAAQAAAVRRTGTLIDTLMAVASGPSDAPEPEAAEAGEWPEVTVVIATRDRPELLRTAIDAVLAQDYPGEIHCLVVHDQAEPDHGLALEKDRRRVSVTVNGRTPGLAGARNTGILAATGTLVAFCDDDDRWLPGKLTAQVTALRATPGAVLACCGIRVLYGETTVDRTLDRRTVAFADLLRSRLTELHPSTFVLRRDALVDGFGLVSEEVPGSYGEDYEFLLRAARHGVIVNVPDVHVEVLWHQRSYFAQRWRTIADALDWLLERFPEFRLVPAGRARITGQIAFAEAASGRRRAALRWAARTARANWREPRAYLAVAVALRLVGADRIVRFLHRRGRGI